MTDSFLHVEYSDTDPVTDRVFETYRPGKWAVLYGRVIPVVRTFVSLPAGLARMSVARFVALTAVGVAAWVTLLSSIGYALGSSWESITRAFGAATYVLVTVGAVAVVAFLVHRLHALRQRGEGAQIAQEREPA
jgi:membrane protein DedA with SNARE-associated domain